MKKLNKKEQKEWDAWVAGRPESVQKLIAKYPPGEYVIQPGAPYGVSCPGTIVNLYGYFDDGTVSVIVESHNKLPAAIEHERQLCIQNNKTETFRLQMLEQDVKVDIDPKWMKPYGI